MPSRWQPACLRLPPSLRILPRGGRVMTGAPRNTGIDPVGNKPWGTHFCHFYETTDDLLETLVPFFKAAPGSPEFCSWGGSQAATLEPASQPPYGACSPLGMLTPQPTTARL